MGSISEAAQAACHRCGKPAAAAPMPGAKRPLRAYCDACVADAERERFEEARIAAAQHDAAKIAQHLATIPPRYRDARADIPDALTWLAELRAGSPRNLLLGGPVGSGKTWQAWGLWRELAMEGGRDIAFARVPRLLDRLRPSSDDTGMLERMQRVDVLFLDDLGAEKPSEWVAERIYEIADERYAWLRPTVVTSNLAPADLAAQVGERIVSRIAHDCRLVVLNGPDRRRS